MKKITATMALLGFSIFCMAQQNKQVVFDYQYLPNKTYVSSTQSNSTIKMESIGDAKKMDSLKKSTPSITNMQANMDIGVNVTTGSLNAEKQIPMTLRYSKFAMEMVVNGKKTNPPMPISNMEITGVIKNKTQLQIDSISGVSDEGIKGMLKSMVEKMQATVKFPDKPVKIGDTFSMAMPINMPVGNVGNMNMEMNTTYLLKAIKDGRAFLDMKQTIAINMAGKGNMKATGSGTGTAVYDIEKKFLTEMTSDSNISMNIQAKPGAAMKMQVETKTTIKTDIK